MLVARMTVRGWRGCEVPGWARWRGVVGRGRVGRGSWPGPRAAADARVVAVGWCRGVADDASGHLQQFVAEPGGAGVAGPATSCARRAPAASPATGSSTRPPRTRCRPGAPARTAETTSQQWSAPGAERAPAPVRRRRRASGRTRPGSPRRVAACWPGSPRTRPHRAPRSRCLIGPTWRSTGSATPSASTSSLDRHQTRRAGQRRASGPPICTCFRLLFLRRSTSFVRHAAHASLAGR